MGNPKKYLVTSALPYANGPLHLGHIAGAYLPADIFVRYLRSKKDDVVFVCGSDEHGAAITIKAKKEGTTPQKVVDEFHELNKLTFEKFGISFDYYDRTSAEHHHKKAQDFFIPFNKLKMDLDHLSNLIEENNVEEVKNILSKLVTSYQSNSKIVDHFYEHQLNLELDLKSSKIINSEENKVVKIRNK